MKKTSLASMNKVILWAVDPYDAETKPSASTVNALRAWSQKSGFRIKPVYLASFPLVLTPQSLLSVLENAEKDLQSFVDQYGLANVLKPEVVLDGSGSRKGAIYELISFAQKNDAAWIALSSHGRSGLKRFAFGSFAEALLAESPFPVLFLPEKNEERAISTALFPTDFSTHSRRAFQRFLPYAKAMGLRVVIFHAISLPTVYATEIMMVPSAYIPDNYFAKQEKAARRTGASWIKKADAIGVEARLELSNRGISMLTGKVLLDAAQACGADLIALSFHSNAFDRLLFGSVALDVFREKRYPVWVCGPQVPEGVRLAPAPKKAKPKKRVTAPGLRPLKRGLRAPHGRDNARVASRA